VAVEGTGLESNGTHEKTARRVGEEVWKANNSPAFMKDVRKQNIGGTARVEGIKIRGNGVAWEAKGGIWKREPQIPHTNGGDGEYWTSGDKSTKLRRKQKIGNVSSVSPHSREPLLFAGTSIVSGLRVGGRFSKPQKYVRAIAIA